MKKEKIPKELQKLSPFFHDIDLGNNLNTAPEIYRIRAIINLFFPPLLKIFGGTLKGLRVLDLGCNCGGFSFEANKHGAKEVIGIDSNTSNIKQANAIKKYLGIKNIKFIKLNIEEVNKKDFGDFDLIIMAGILYHLEDPIGVMKKISKMANSTILIDSHVHYSSGQDEDIPSWWMLNDMDKNNLEGLFVDDTIIQLKKYLEFDQKVSVDYGRLQNQFIPSPQTAKDIGFINKYIPHPSEKSKKEYNIGANNENNLALIPNKKALFKLVRYYGFEDILEIAPHRFSPIPYIKKHRVGLLAMKRDKNNIFPMSEYQKINTPN